MMDGGEGTGRVLVCAATAFELDALPADFAPGAQRLVTGVGIPRVFETMDAALAGTGGDGVSLILNLGIAGAYRDAGIAIGDIVLGDEEVYGDVGFELPETPGFRHLRESDFGAEYADPLPLFLPDFLLRSAPTDADYSVHAARRGCTVNACTGTEATGRWRSQTLGAAFETMEGAAVAQVARRLGVPVAQVRGISNLAAQRDMRPENIRRALANLRHYLDACRRMM
jgi:Nucleoside phosphorylase